LIKQYEEIIKDKIDVFRDMIDNLKDLNHGNHQFVQEEELIADKRLAVEIWERDIYQKKRVNLDVQMNIQMLMTLIEDTEKEIAERQEKINELQGELHESNSDLHDFVGDSQARDERITELQNQIAQYEDERARLEAEAEAERLRLEEEMRNRPKMRVKYIPVKGDKTDERMAIYMNNFDLDVPMVRTGEGNYVFGTRKIFAKIMNEKLVIRVGGGFMLIEEFLPTYGQQELDKINQRQLASGGNTQSMTSFNSKAPGSPTRRMSPTNATG
jgi:predicted RNase H-like nuclease (RuvC/YqgF family)